MTRYLVDENDCWVWQGHRSRQGYGMVWRRGANRLAHREYYADAHGACPPTLDHLCRNRACVNPNHLEPCSRGENVRRGNVAKLNWDVAKRLRVAAEEIAGSQRAQARVLAERFGIPASTVRGILRDKRWPEADRPVTQWR